MRTGWFEVGSDWYYADGSGAMAFSRWIGDYYVGASGAMVTNGFTPDGYYCGPDGYWQYMYLMLGDGRCRKTKNCPTLNESSRIVSGTFGGVTGRTTCGVRWH